MLQSVPVWDDYVGTLVGYMFVNVLPENTVAVDFDAYNWKYSMYGDQRDFFLSKVRNFCTIFSDIYDLGRFWIISTLSGFHAIFEKPNPNWATIIRDATRQWIWEGGCEGDTPMACQSFAETCYRHDYIELRVGRKLDRPWDLELAIGSLDGAPPFIVEHVTAIETLRRLDV